VTEDVPADSLAIARAAQVNRADWAAKRRIMLARSSSAGKEQPAGERKFQKSAAPSKGKGR
jgi:bifunctional UDP-N-acetylglucosamine pyrophosphorylase/glucosamine-1-phosphate N-acetyltransferase